MLRGSLKRLYGRRLGSFVKLLLILSALALFVQLLTRTRPGLLPRSLVASADASRRRALVSALRAWRSGPLPEEVAALAASCPPADAAGAALDLGSGQPNVVVDVGANQGHPVTLGALQRHARLVLSVEPDERNFGMLSKRAHNLLPAGGGSRFVGVHGAAGAEASIKRMLFHRTRNDFSCFTCLDARKSEVYGADVRVATVDKLLEEAAVKADDEISLLKTDTQGFERQVLLGASAVFDRKMVKAVIVEFDPKLLGRRENAVGVLEKLVDYGMECVHLAFSGRKSKSVETPRFPSLPVTNANAGLFYEFVVAQGGWTDLFCLRPPA